METARVALTDALGAGSVREATAADEVAGVRPQLVANVDSTERVSAALRVADAYGLRVVPKGSGSKLGWGGVPDGVDLLLDVSAASGIVEHAAGDLVVHVLAGTPIAEIDKTVRAEGQQLAIDQPLPGATVGGVIATGTSGPGRHLFGGVRDLLIGITVVRADGTVTVSGGKVVKNVAGYDLGKIYTGSYGTLGVITEAVFRLHPVAGEHRWVSFTTGDAVTAQAAADLIRHSQAMATAIELDRPGPGGEITICAQLEGRPQATHERALDLARTIGDGATVLEKPPAWWAQYPFDAKETGLRVGVEPSAVAGLIAAIEQTAKTRGLAAAVRGAAGLGVLHVGLPGSADATVVAGFVTELREHSEYAVVERAGGDVLAQIDPWGPVAPGVLTLMRRTKDQFDPQHRLAPGRFVGGI